MKISVVIPSYNRRDLIAETLEAVLTQTHAPGEVVVVDDASTDGTPEEVGKWGKYVTLIRLAENGGQQTARNVGIDNSSGDLIAFCDLDDVWLPDHLKLHHSLFCAHDLDFCFSNYRYLYGGSPSVRTKFEDAPEDYWETADRRICPTGWVFDKRLAAHAVRLFRNGTRRAGFYAMLPSAVVVSRAHVENVGRWNPALRRISVEDLEFTLRCLYDGRAGAVPEPTLLVRRHDSNFTVDASRVLFDEIALLEWIMENHHDAGLIMADLTERLRHQRVLGVHAAFAAGRHDLVRSYFAQVSLKDRNAKLWAKRLLSARTTWQHKTPQLEAASR